MYDFSSALAKMAEAKILEAMKNGEFDDLPGKGKPLQLEDLSMVPEDLRAAYMLLKNGGYLPQELEVSKEMATLERLIDCCTREDEKSGLRARLLAKTIKFSLLKERLLSRQSPTKKGRRNRPAIPPRNSYPL